MSNLSDCTLPNTLPIAIARSTGISDARMGKKLRKLYQNDPARDQAYRHGYSEEAFHLVKQKLLSDAEQRGTLWHG